MLGYGWSFCLSYDGKARSCKHSLPLFSSVGWVGLRPPCRQLRAPWQGLDGLPSCTFARGAKPQAGKGIVGNACRVFALHPCLSPMPLPACYAVWEAGFAPTQTQCATRFARNWHTSLAAPPPACWLDSGLTPPGSSVRATTRYARKCCLRLSPGSPHPMLVCCISLYTNTLTIQMIALY